MNATAYYITVVTQGVELAEYDEVASALVKAFYILTSEHLTEFTKPHLSEPRCEVEVMASANDGDSKFTVQAVAILQANSPKPWTLDKNKLTALFKTELPFAFKLTKRAVDKAELASVIQDAAVASSSMIASSSSSE